MRLFSLLPFFAAGALLAQVHRPVEEFSTSSGALTITASVTPA